jgi:hypothetical protein
MGPGFRRESATRRANTLPRKLLSAALLAVLPLSPIHAAEPQHCVQATVILWGDGRHDDTAALNAWLRGENALWGDSGAPVGTAIVGHDFRLSAGIYVNAGVVRTLRDFHMVWPQRSETVAGGTIRTGGDPNQAPVISGVRIVGGDPGEGRPFDAPDQPPKPRNDGASCGIS